MGNSGGKVSTELNESKLEELMKKTGLSSDEIRRMHAEFLVRLTHCFSSNFKCFFMTIIKKSHKKRSVNKKMSRNLSP